ncbi:MAG TPA: condensation domain-containing protein [Streptosporangiaceae bacterium]|nr:condensation domain-containing protein [Streptosporangiaceae bacterium]
MLEPIGRDAVVVEFAGAHAGTAPLTWGQKAIYQDMCESGNQFNMGGRMELPPGTTIGDAAARLRRLILRHAALRMRLRTDGAGRPGQEIAGSGEIGLDILTIPDEADEVQVASYAADLMDTWPRARSDFERDWPLRMAVIKQADSPLYLVWVLSHLATDGGGHILMLEDLMADESAGREVGDPRHPDVLDLAADEQEPHLRQLSKRTMRHWESALKDIPAQTFAESAGPGGRPPGEAPRYWQARFRSPATHLAVLGIAARTGTDLSRATIAIIATAIGRVTGASRLTIKVMVNNRFRPGLADVIAPIAQNSVLTIDFAGATVDEVVTRTKNGTLTAGMRAYYDPDDLRELTARLDADRGYRAAVTCRINDQRAMIMRSDSETKTGEVSGEMISRALGETTLTWLGRRDNMHEQVNILIENRPGVVSLHMMWDRWCLSDGQVEAILRGVEEVAVEAAFDPAVSGI